MYHFTALVTLLTGLYCLATGIMVARARRRYGIKAPAIVGNPDFERVYRVQINALEWLPIFLPALWLFAIYVGDAVAGGLGLVWIIGRVIYMIGYMQAAARRSPGFAIQALASIALWVGALGAVVWRIAQG